MSITVKDLYQYNPNFDPKDVVILTGKTDFKKDDTIVLSRVTSLNDNDFSIFVAEKEGKSFINTVQDHKKRAELAEAANVDISDRNQKTANMPSAIPMNKSIFDIKKPQENYA